MKLGILTLPLHNYGGILQAYALQKTLETLGHEVWILQRENSRIYGNKWKQYINHIKRLIKRVLNIPILEFTEKEINVIERERLKFVKKYLHNRSPYLLSVKTLKKYVINSGIDGIVVGSDQVWRPLYNFDVRNNFLDFCEDNSFIKRIAYAASFGVDKWEFTKEQTLDCKRLASLFDYISVREDSGISLCREHLEVSATLVLDPTMLLEKEEYIKLTQEWNEPKSKGDLFCYILNKNDYKTMLINNISKYANIMPFSVYPPLNSTVINFKKSPNDCIYPRVTQWLRAFQDAKMVLTDSFHGCVFSIIFNIPFWVVGNASRGNARFDSLLRLFHLESRMIDVNAEGIDYNEPIDWESVNRIRSEMIVKSKAVFDSLC